MVVCWFYYCFEGLHFVFVWYFSLLYEMVARAEEQITFIVLKLGLNVIIL